MSKTLIECETETEKQEHDTASESASSKKKKRRKGRKKKKKSQESSASTSSVSTQIAPGAMNGAIQIDKRESHENPYQLDEVQLLFEKFKKIHNTSTEFSPEKMEEYFSHIDHLIFKEHISVEAHMIIESMRFIVFAADADFKSEKINILVSINLLQHLANMIFFGHDLHRVRLNLNYNGSPPQEERCLYDTTGEIIQFLLQCSGKYDVEKERFSSKLLERVAIKPTHEMFLLIDSILNILFDELLNNSLFSAKISEKPGHIGIVHEADLVSYLGDGINILSQIAPNLEPDIHDSYLFKLMLIVFIELHRKGNEVLQAAFSEIFLDSFTKLTCARGHKNVYLDQMLFILVNIHEDSLEDGDGIVECQEKIMIPFMRGIANNHEDQDILKAAFHIMGEFIAYARLEEKRILIAGMRNMGSTIQYYDHAGKNSHEFYKDFLNTLFFILPPELGQNKREIDFNGFYSDVIAGNFLFGLLLDPGQKSTERIVDACTPYFLVDNIEFSIEEKYFSEPRRYLKNLGFLLASMFCDPAAKEFYAQTMFYYIQRIEQNETFREELELVRDLISKLKLEISGNFDEHLIYHSGKWDEFAEMNRALRQSMPGYEFCALEANEEEKNSRLESLVTSMLIGDEIKAQDFLEATEGYPWHYLFAGQQDCMRLYCIVMIPAIFNTEERINILASYLTVNFDVMGIDNKELLDLDSKEFTVLFLFLLVAQKGQNHLHCFPMITHFLNVAFQDGYNVYEIAFLQKISSESVAGRGVQLTDTMQHRFIYYEQPIVRSFLRFTENLLKEESFYTLKTVPLVEVLDAIGILSDEPKSDDNLSINVFLLLLEQWTDETYINSFLVEMEDRGIVRNKINLFRNKINLYCEHIGEWTQRLIDLHEKLKTFNLTKQEKRQLNLIFNKVSQVKIDFVKQTKDLIEFQIKELDNSKKGLNLDLYFKDLIQQLGIPLNLEKEFGGCKQRFFEKVARPKIKNLKKAMTQNWVLDHVKDSDISIRKKMQACEIPEQYFDEINEHFERVLQKNTVSKQGEKEVGKSSKKETSRINVASASSDVYSPDFTERIRCLDLEQISSDDLYSSLRLVFSHSSEFTKLDASSQKKLFNLLRLHATDQFVRIQQIPGESLTRDLNKLIENWQPFANFNCEANDFLEQLKKLQDDPKADAGFRLGFVVLGNELFKFSKNPYQLSVYPACEGQTVLEILLDAELSSIGLVDIRKESPIVLYRLINDAYALGNFHHVELLHKLLWQKFDSYLMEILQRQMEPETGDLDLHETVYGHMPTEAIENNISTIYSQYQQLFNLIPDAWLFGGMVLNFFSERAPRELKQEYFDLDIIAPSFESAEELIDFLNEDGYLRSMLSRPPFTPCKKLPYLVRLTFHFGFEIDIHVGSSNKLSREKFYCPLTALQMAHQFNVDKLPFSGVDYQKYQDDLAYKLVRFPNLEGNMKCIEEPEEIAILLALMMKSEYQKGCTINPNFKLEFGKQVTRVFEGLFQPDANIVSLVNDKHNKILNYKECKDPTYKLCIEKLEEFIEGYKPVCEGHQSKFFGRFFVEVAESGSDLKNHQIDFPVPDEEPPATWDHHYL